MNHPFNRTRGRTRRQEGGVVTVTIVVLVIALQTSGLANADPGVRLLFEVGRHFGRHVGTNTRGNLLTVYDFRFGHPYSPWSTSAVILWL